MAEEEKQREGRRHTKHRHRAIGTGSLYYREDRKRWVAQIILENGKTKQRYCKTQEEAADALNEMLYEQKRGMLATGPQQTVKQFMEYWLEEVHKPTIRISSFVEYRRILNNHILPTLGHVRLQQLTVQQVESLYARLAKEGLTAKTISGIHGVLRKGLTHAVYLNLIQRNVCDIVKKSLPRKPRHEAQTLTREQAQRLLERVRGRYPWEAMFTLAIITGMRRGELVALRWSDVHLEERYLQVCRSARRPGLGYTLQVSEPKTASSRRKIVLSPFLIEILQQHRSRQEAIRQAIGNAWREQDLVFCNRNGGFMNIETMRIGFKKLLKDAGLPSMRFHDLRHSAATLLLAMGVHVKVVQELLGHSNVLITLNTYSHVLPTLHEKAMDELSNLFNNDHGKDAVKDNNGNEGRAE
jgi:integrase